MINSGYRIVYTNNRDDEPEKKVFIEPGRLAGYFDVLDNEKAYSGEDRYACDNGLAVRVRIVNDPRGRPLKRGENLVLVANNARLLELITHELNIDFDKEKVLSPDQDADWFMRRSDPTS